VKHQGSPDLLSEGMALGAVQIPADGQPMVMMSDRPTTGGYPKIATVVRASLPLLAQCQPGSAEVRFRAVSVHEAQTAYRRLLTQVEEGISYGED
jgi:allophanate hydrolase subunit 2